MTEHRIVREKVYENQSKLRHSRWNDKLAIRSYNQATNTEGQTILKVQGGLQGEIKFFRLWEDGSSTKGKIKKLLHSKEWKS